MDTIFTIKNEHLERLSPSEAVDIFRELLWAETTALGIGKNLICVPSKITVADGGIDAEIESAGVSGGQGIIKQGLTRYQIKTGDFSPSQKRRIKSILLSEKSKVLKPRVKSCLDKNGTLVIILFGWDNPEVKDDDVKDRFIKELTDIDKKYKAARIEIWRQNNLIGFLSTYPSLALKVNGLGGAIFESHKSWSEHDDMRKDLRAGQEQEKLMIDLQAELRRDNEAVHVRIWGEPGAGKTKLVIEATRTEDLSALVIYCDSAQKFRDSVLMNEIIKEDNRFFVLLVIDECDPDSRSYIWNKLKHYGPRIKLVSIYNEFDDTSGTIAYFNTPLLQKEQIARIIQDCDISKDQADRWSDFCSGSPRVAHVIGWNLRNNPEDLLKTPDTVNVWERYIVGGDDPNSAVVQQRRLVLQHIALFKRFGYGPSLVSEAKVIAEMVRQADPQVTWARFQEIIANLKSRRILQGENTLYISPRLLHIWLWAQWWNVYGSAFGLKEFSKGLPPKLMEWFYEMFAYASGSQVAVRVVKELLGPDGPFQNNGLLRDELGANFFLALAEADPGSALHCLKNTIGTWGKEKLLQFTTGRREVVWALEKIAVWRELFGGAARILLALGEAENETYSNNASGVFAELFSAGYGRVGSTEASPEERYPVLREALESGSKARRLLALNACDNALESQYGIRSVGAEYQGLRKEPQLWMPKTYGELFDAYRRVWQLLRGKLDTLEADEQQEALKILLSRSRALGHIQNLEDMVLETISDLVEKPYVDRKDILTKIVQVLHYDGKMLKAGARRRWEQLRDKLTGSDFSSLMKRYVGMDLLEDEFDEQGNRVDQRKPRIEELANQAVENPDLLSVELTWLLTTEAQNGYLFGYELGKRDKTFVLLPILIKAQRKAKDKLSTYFLGGYFRALFEKDKVLWEKELEALVDDDKLSKWVPELTWRSGISDQAALRILSMAEKGTVGVQSFDVFAVGRAIEGLSERVFTKWIEFLLEGTDVNAILIALDLLEFYYLRRKRKHTLPKKLALKLLTHQSLFQRSEVRKRRQMDEYHWTEIGKAFVDTYPKDSLAIADKMLQHFGEDGTIVEGFHSSVQEVLNEITRRYPQETWGKIQTHLGPPVNSKTFHITQWLRGGSSIAEKEGALSLIPLKEIWKWVDKDMDKRSWYLASFVPKTLHRERGKVCLARELLMRYGDRKDVRRNLMANFSSELWWGPASAHFTEKREKLLDFKKVETDENVKRWIDEYVSLLDKDIELERIQEEREV